MTEPMTTEPPNFVTALKDVLRLLTFRLGNEGFVRLGGWHLAVGMLFTWIVGMGRWWDDPGANILQHLGIGSLIYIFILSAILWIEVLILRPREWSYLNVLTFVSMTSLPALLYSLPVEQFLSLPGAQLANFIFLLIVSVWRVAMLAYYLSVRGKLNLPAVGITTLLPLTAIVTVLTILNLERAAFETMGGFRGEPTSHDSAYAFLAFLTFFSVLMFVPLLMGYFVLVLMAWISKD